MKTIYFESETLESLNNKNISSIDFCEDFAGKPITATLIDRLEDQGPAWQDGLLFELDGAECRYALLTNAYAVYADDLSDFSNDPCNSQ